MPAPLVAAKALSFAAQNPELAKEGAKGGMISSLSCICLICTCSIVMYFMAKKQCAKKDGKKGLIGRIAAFNTIEGWITMIPCLLPIKIIAIILCSLFS